MTFPKPGKNPKFPKNLCPNSLLSTAGKLFEEVILKIVHRHIEERGLLNANRFGFHARHSMTLQCMRLTDHATLNFNNNISTAAVFLDIEKSFDTTWYLGLLYKLSEITFSISLIKRVSSFLSHIKFRVSFNGDMSTPRDTEAGVPQGSVLYPIWHSIYINDTPKIPGVYLGLFDDNSCIYVTDRKDGYVLRKLQRGLSVIDTWCECWNIKINKDKAQAIYFSHRLGPPEAHFTLNGRNIPFVNHVKYPQSISTLWNYSKCGIYTVESEAGC
jgi:hypothetical protein